jgi:hypothetical protein
VEEAFEHKVVEFAASAPAYDVAAHAAENTDGGSAGAGKAFLNEENSLAKPDGIDKSMLAIATPRRYRNREHLRYVAQQACLICGRKQSDPHHLRYLQPRALGRKVSDEFAVPLCRSHHRAVHRAGDEKGWWKTAGIDPVKVARQLWRQTRLNNPQDLHQSDLLVRPKIESIVSASESTSQSRSDRVLGRADDGRAP